MAIAFCKGKYNVGVAELRVTGCWLLGATFHHRFLFMMRSAYDQKLQVTGCWALLFMIVISLLMIGLIIQTNYRYCRLIFRYWLLSATNTFNGRDSEHYTIEDSFCFFS